MAPKVAPVALRNVTPAIPEGEKERAELEQDLKRMRCKGLLRRPWDLKHEDIVRELVGVQDGTLERSNCFDNTIRDQPELWTVEAWREVYGFPGDRAGLANRVDPYAEGRFVHLLDPKDGYAIRDCLDERQCRMLGFLIPIIHPEKSTRVTITLANTVFGVLDGNRKVD